MVFLTHHALFSQETEELKVLESYLRKADNNSVYYKTAVIDIETPIEDYIQNSYLEFLLCTEDQYRNFKISESELRLVKEKFSKQSITRIDRLIPGLKTKTAKKHKRFKTNTVSLPATFRNGTFAIIYSNRTYGSEFKLLKKEGDTWQVICSNLIWIE